MRTLLIALALVLTASAASAQVPATPASYFTFTQAAATLPEAQGYTYRLAEAGQPVRVLTVVCTGTASPFTCESQLGAFSSGAHTVMLTTGNAAGESAPSAPLTFTMLAIPSTPQAFTISLKP